MQFDLLIKGGTLVIPGSSQQGAYDVAIRGDRIAAIDSKIPIESAVQVIDAQGQYVTPGLVDMHTHVYHSATYWGIDANPVAARSGVTTWVDAGSAGAYNLMGLQTFIVEQSPLRIYAFINISSIGLTGPTWELANLNYCDVDLCVKLIEAFPEFVRGIKVRIDANTTGGQGVEPLRRARAVADRCQRPVMVHIGSGPPTIGEVLALLQPGDILTHCFTGQNMRIIDEQGRLLDEAKRALDMGVILDVGHGVGGLAFASAEAVMAAGYRSHVISSDLHQSSILGPVYDLPTCLSKFMALGMGFAEVIEAATTRPAAVLGLADELGTLRVGGAADVALFTVEQGRFPLYDASVGSLEASQLLRNTVTVVRGQILPRLSDPPQAPWLELSQAQRSLVERGHTPDALTRSRTLEQNA